MWVTPRGRDLPHTTFDAYTWNAILPMHVTVDVPIEPISLSLKPHKER